MGIDRGEITVVYVCVKSVNGERMICIRKPARNADEILCARAVGDKMGNRFLDFRYESFVDGPCGFRWNKSKFRTGFFHKILVDGHFQKYPEQNGDCMLVLGELKGPELFKNPGNFSHRNF